MEVGLGAQGVKPRSLTHNNKTSGASWPNRPDPLCTAGGGGHAAGGTLPQEAKTELHNLPSQLHPSIVRAPQMLSATETFPSGNRSNCLIINPRANLYVRYANSN